MGSLAVFLALITLILFYLGSRFLRDARAIRKELSDGRTLKELDDMVRDSREELLADYDRISENLDRKIDRLEKLNRKAEEMTARLEGVLKSERLKILEERGILFAIETSDKLEHPGMDRNKRIAELLKGGASVEEVARITEASVREVELVRLLIRRREEAEGA